MGARISGGGPCGVHEAGGAPHMVGPPGVFSVPIILKYSRKNYIKFSGHLENFYFWDIFYCKINSENRQKILILLYLYLILKGGFFLHFFVHGGTIKFFVRFVAGLAAP